MIFNTGKIVQDNNIMSKLTQITGISISSNLITITNAILYTHFIHN